VWGDLQVHFAVRVGIPSTDHNDWLSTCEWQICTEGGGGTVTYPAARDDVRPMRSHVTDYSNKPWVETANLVCWPLLNDALTLTFPPRCFSLRPVIINAGEIFTRADIVRLVMRYTVTTTVMLQMPKSCQGLISITITASRELSPTDIQSPFDFLL